MLGNPHFPWDGAERFYESQLTIPGKINVEGGKPARSADHQHRAHGQPRLEPHGLHRVPLHAVRAEARARRPALLHLRRPDRAHGGRERDDPGAADGRLAGPQTRTLYSTHSRRRGATRSSPTCSAPLPWTPATAWAMGDANAGNFRYLNHFFEVNNAQSVSELDGHHQAQPGHPMGQHDRLRPSGRRLLRRHLGHPEGDRRGGGRLQHGVGQAAFAALGLPFLDGSLSSCEWGDRTPMRSTRARSARRTCRSLHPATTTSRTRTTATGCRTRSIRSRASTASSATSAPSASLRTRSG